jgi:hypothetical protein
VPVGEGNVALVCFARRVGEPVVLKVNPRQHPEARLLAAEGAGLEFWSETGAAARLLDERDAGMTLLLDRVLPGDSLDDAGDAWEAKLEILGGLVSALHSAGKPPHSIPGIGEYAQGWRAELDDPGLVRELEDLTPPPPTRSCSTATCIPVTRYARPAVGGRSTRRRSAATVTRTFGPSSAPRRPAARFSRPRGATPTPPGSTWSGCSPGRGSGTPPSDRAAETSVT